MKPWKTHSSKIAFDNPWMKIRNDIVELQSGRIIDDYYVWLEGDVSIIVPITSDEKFLLVKQYKHGAGQIMIEFPAGMVDSGETPENAAHRELLEETGYSSSSISLIGKFVNTPTKVVGQHFLFLARDVEPTTQPEQSDIETIETLFLSKEELLGYIYSGKIWVSGTISAAFLAFQSLQ